MDMHIGKPLIIEALSLFLTSPAELSISGTLNSPTTHNAFAKQIDDLHGYILARQLPSFTIDVRQLGFVNSSAIRLFVNWISRAQQAGYKTVFITDERITWHRLSFSVLKSLAPSTVEIRSAPLAAGAEGGK